MSVTFKIKRFVILVIGLLLLASYLPAYSQVLPTHYVGLWADFGYSLLPFQSDYTKSKGGVGGGLSAFYEFQYGKLRINTGVGFDWLNNKSLLNDFTAEAKIINLSYPQTYHYEFSNWEEKQLYGRLTIPLMAGAQFNNLYFLAGAKVGLGMVGTYKMASNLHTYITDDELIDELGNMPTHHLENQTLTQKGKSKYKPDFMLSAEVGMNLDKWLAVEPKPLRRGQRQRKKTFKESLHYRVALFADYGLNNINNYTKNSEESTGNLLVVNAEDASQVHPYTLLGSSNMKDDKLNSFFAGVKFAVMYEVPQKLKKPIPTPKPTSPPASRPKPEPKPQPKSAVDYFLCGRVVDAESAETLAAQIEIFTEAGVSVYQGESDGRTGLFPTSLKSGKYGAHVVCQGYMPYEENFSFVKDTVNFALQKIKAGRKIVLHNLFFATNKTDILPESEAGLEDLYLFLTDNSEVHIKIVGHTDNVGSEINNKKLSEGRARSVVEVMKSFGIAPERLEWEGRGESDPIAANDTEEGRAQNRRVEFVILSMP